MASFLDGLLSPPRPPSSGLLGEPRIDPAGDQRMAMAAALLQGSGPSPYRQGISSILGNALMAGQQARQASQQMQQQQQEAEQMKVYRDAQIAKMQQPEPEPADVRTARALQNDPQLKAAFEDMQRLGLNVSDPADVRIYKFRQSLTPEQRAEFDRTRFAPPAVSVQELAGGKSIVDPGNRLGGGTIRPLTTVADEAAGAATISGARSTAEAAGRVTGAAGAQAVVDLPTVQATADQTVKVLTDLKAHPGLPYITGVASKVPVVPGTPQAGADALAKQVEGKAFLQAFQTLKGGGQITEVEGTKATQAIARLSRAQSTKEYQKALDELLDVAVTAKERAARAAAKGAQITGAPQAAPPMNRPSLDSFQR